MKKKAFVQQLIFTNEKTKLFLEFDAAHAFNKVGVDVTMTKIHDGSAYGIMLDMDNNIPKELVKRLGNDTIPLTSSEIRWVQSIREIMQQTLDIITVNKLSVKGWYVIIGEDKEDVVS